VKPLDLTTGERVMSPRDAYLCESETLNAKDSVGRVCACPTVSCPPAIPIVISGERIKESHVALFESYGIEKVAVVKE
jgi:arginine/lysine/ornithine decarboxylase